MSSPEAALREAIEQCYAAFSAMPRPCKIEGSSLRDHQAILRTLTSAPLRQLTGEQIGGYASWAMTTVGNDRDYRHFLPRIFELSIDDPTWLGTEPPVMASKLKMAGWQTWPFDQQQAVLHFFQAAFRAALNVHPDDSESAASWLCGLTDLGQPPAPYLESWRGIHEPNAALQLASFINSEAENLKRHGEVRGPFWGEVDQKARMELATLLLSDATHQFLSEAVTHVSEEDILCTLGPALHEFR